ncbi:MAG: hypothetical protein IPI58_03595 [Alphaproteobacteria bacterium]|nr:MAG: hypothetical protein IPI58_03595 [Alphaproteobacteria bacterium]
MNSRRMTILGAVTTILMSVVLYKTSYHYDEARRALQDTHVQMMAERESLHVLQAEWALLNQPKRLERLAARHLGLKNADHQQIMAAGAMRRLNQDPAPLVARVEQPANGKVLLGTTSVVKPAAAIRRPAPAATPQRVAMMEEGTWDGAYLDENGEPVLRLAALTPQN